MATKNTDLTSNPFVNWRVSPSGDAMFNLGAVLGGMWAKNYNERGISKGEEEAQSVLNEYANSDSSGSSSSSDNTSYDKNNGAYSNSVGYGENSPEGNRPAGNSGNRQQPRHRSNKNNEVPDDLFKQGIAAGAIGRLYSDAMNNPNAIRVGNSNYPTTVTMHDYTQGNSAQPISYGIGDMPNVRQGRQAPPSGNGENKRDLKAEKLDYVANKYSGTSPNPDGDAISISNMTSKGRNALSEVDASKVGWTTADQLKTAIRNRLRKSGRSDFQIDSVLENLTPAINNKVKEGQAYQYGKLAGAFAAQMKTGDYEGAGQTYGKMLQIAPEETKYGFGTQIANVMDRYAQEGKLRNQIGLLTKYGGLSESEAAKYALFGNNGYGGANGGYGRNGYSSRYSNSSRYGESSGRNGSGRNSSNGKSSKESGSIYSNAEYQKMMERVGELEDKRDNDPRGLSNREKEELEGLYNRTDEMRAPIYSYTDKAGLQKIANIVETIHQNTNMSYEDVLNKVIKKDPRFTEYMIDNAEKYVDSVLNQPSVGVFKALDEQSLKEQARREQEEAEKTKEKAKKKAEEQKKQEKEAIRQAEKWKRLEEWASTPLIEKAEGKTGEEDESKKFSTYNNYLRRL